MLAMMPGSLLDKTNNHLSNIACLHLNITKHIGPEKECRMDVTHSCDLSSASAETEVNNAVLTEVNNSVTKETVESTDPANNLTSDSGSTVESKSSSNTLEKTQRTKKNTKRKLWKEQLSKAKRQAREMQNRIRVLSSKLKRYYFKQEKLNWVKCPIRIKNTAGKRTQKSKKKLIKNTNDTKQLATVESDNKIAEKGNQITEANKSNILLPIIPSFKADDDIRNKIKQQLELLRTNRKVSSRNNEEEIDETSKLSEISEDNKVFSENNTDVTASVESTNCTSTVKPVTANLSEVLLSNEGELSIISVVGGYVSDEEMRGGEESTKADSCENVHCYTSSVGKGTSMTDILLQRDFSATQDESVVAPHLITPKKTKDITKIKGWKSKQFSTVANNLFETVTDDVHSSEELESEPMESAVVCMGREILANTRPDDPIPSTSTGIVGTDPVREASKLESAHILPEPDNILKQGEDAKSEKNAKSAFVSAVLDTYLSNHAELKISYEVPKLKAEEAITKPVSEMPVTGQDYLVLDQSKTHSKSSKHHKKNLVKPKTLAEKRRMLEVDRRNQLLQDMSVNEAIYLKKLEYCEKRAKNDIAKDIRESLINARIPFSRYCWIMATKCDEQAKQFAVVNGDKIRINGSCGGESLIINDACRNSDGCTNTANADASVSAKGCILNRFSKPSLIGTDRRKSGVKRPVQYKPGPLSKKRKLLKNLQPKENWECHVLKMPKIKLVLYPEEGKRIPVIAEKYLQLCRSENGFISDEWAKFAVSAVRSETKEKTKVEFELPYANRQNKLLVRKRNYNDIRSESGTSAQVRNENKFPDVNVEDIIKDVMSDMLDCIDNQQLDKIVIGNDPDLRDRYKTNAEDNHCRPPSPINSMVKAIIKRSNAKKSKTTLELRRLNVQVIEVDVKEDETENTDCTNDFCRLGCICKSLRGPSGIVPEHCGRAECMLECKCTFGVSQRVHHSITLPAGTDLLSASTVVRLQDEAKRNLAKEERKFTQTVIKANNQTIMVGGGSRERQRRVPKVPKKYSNYVQKSNKSLSYMEMISNGLLEDEQDPDFKLNKYQMQKTQATPKMPGEHPPGVIKLKKLVPIWTKEENDKSSIEMAAKLCRVRIEKLQLENVTPWCMVHNLYQCHCGGKAVPKSNAASSVIKSKNEEEQSEVNRTINEENPVGNEYISYASRYMNRYHSETGSSLPATEDKYSARTRALATNYYQSRNKSQHFKARYAQLKEDEERKIVKSVQSNEMTNKKQVNNPHNYNIYEIQDDDDDNVTHAVEPVPDKTKPPRTDITYVDVDEIMSSKDDAAVQVQDCTSETADKSCHLLSSPSFIDYDRSFVGLLIPSEEWFKRLQRMLKLGYKENSQMRLLEWATLVRRQKCGTLQMWFKNKKYNNILLTEDRRRPSRNHMNIKLFENTPLDKFKVPDIISCIFTNKLPGKASKASDTYVILVFDGCNWEARGTIVLSASLEMYHTRLAHRPTPVSLLAPNLEYKLSSAKAVKSKEKPTESNSQSLVIRSTPSMSVEVVNNQLPASPPPPPPLVQPSKKGIEITKVTVDKESPKPASILVALPTGFKHKRWFALFLENDFSVLRIADSDFHIKYTHLNTAMQMAKNNERTVRIRSQGSRTPDTRDNFGIYVVQDFGDRIFFGPYANGTGHGLETFRYVNSKLVNTKIYNKMRGTMSRNTCGQWYVHTSTVYHELHLVPETEDIDSSGSECCTEVTSPENAVKPRIEFVDLTANDSDGEDSTDKGQVDPIFNVLSADFSRKVSSDVTIEPVGAKKKAPAFTSINNSKSSDVVIQHLPNRNSVIIETKKSTLPTDTNRLGRKRKSVGDSSQEPAKKQPTIIDSINLDLDDDDDDADTNTEPASKTVTRSANNSRLMPELQPMVETPSSKREPPATSKIVQLQIQNASYVITNIPGVGYFEIVRYESKYHIQMNIENKTIPAFLSIPSAIAWLELLFHKNVYFMPVNLKMQFSNLQSTEVPDMPKFKEMYLNGFHMICEKGIFDLLRMNNNDLANLGFNQSDFSLLLAHKCELLIKRDVKILGRMLFQPDELRKMDRDTILKMAPLKVKSYETAEKHLLSEKKKLWGAQQNLLYNINTRIQTVPASVRNTVKQNIVTLFNKIPAVKMIEKNSAEDADTQQKTLGVASEKIVKLPVGKVCKIVNGKVIITDKQILSVSKDLAIAKKLPASNGQTSSVKSYATGAGKAENKFEMLVPISGLQTPVTVVGMSSISQKTPPAPSMLYSNHTISPKVVDLTDD